MHDRRSQTLRVLALISTVATGFSALVYEVCWHRYLSNIVGSEARATSIILAVYLGGMSIGYEIFGRWSQRRSPRFNVKLLGYCEIAIGIWAILSESVSTSLMASASLLPLNGAGSLVGELLYACVLLLLPTVLMGGTLPLLTQGMSQGLEGAPRFHAKVYGFNTAGAFLGCLAAGFFLIPLAGLPLTLYYAAGMNLLAGLLLAGISNVIPQYDNQAELADSRSKTNGMLSDQAVLSSAGSLSRMRCFIIASIAGFCSICLQTILVRVTGLALGASEYAFSMIVSLFIFTLAAGAMTVSSDNSNFVKTLQRNQIYLLLGGLVVYWTIPYWPYINHLVRISFSNSAIAFYGYFLANFICIGLILIALLVPMGRTLPLLFAVGEMHPKGLGRYVGTLYGLNTFGCVLGSLLGGYLALYFFDLDQVFKFVLMLMLLMVLLTKLGPAKRIKFISLFLLAWVIIETPLWNKTQLGQGAFRFWRELDKSYAGKNAFYDQYLLPPGTRLLAYKDGPSSTVAVYDFVDEVSHEGRNQPGIDLLKTDEAPKDSVVETYPQEQSSQSLMVNGKSDGSTAGMDLVTTELLAHLPALFHRGQTGEAAVIGFGTGITVGNLAVHPELRAIDLIEISEPVQQFAKYFEFANLGADKNQKINWIMADAYRALMATQKTFDVIVSEPSNPWVTGVERLYTQDFYKVIKRKLSPGGIYAQWFHTYSISPSTLGLVVNTYHSVFPYIYTFKVGGADLILIGSETSLGDENIRAMKARFYNREVLRQLAKINITRPEHLMVKEVFNPPELYEDAGIHSLEFPKLSFAAGRDFFRNENTQIHERLGLISSRDLVNSFAKDSLFAIYDRLFRESTIPGRREQIQQYCSLTEGQNELPVDWIGHSQLCRSLLYQANKEGVFSKSLHGTDEVSKDLLSDYSPETWTTANAKNFFRGAILIQSPFSPLSLEELKRRGSICYQPEPDADCIASQLKALYVAGFDLEASRILEDHSDYLQQKKGANFLNMMIELKSEVQRHRAAHVKAHQAQI